MKIAAIMAGEPRFCQEFDLFLNSLRNYEYIDWYMFFWSTSQYGGSYGFDLVAPNWLSIDQNWAIQKLTTTLPPNHRLAGLALDDRKKVLVPEISNKASETSIERMWSMYSSLEKADLLRRSVEEQKGPYDLVIRARPDIGIRGTIDLGELAMIIKEDKKTLITPNKEIHGYGYWINDMISFGSSYSMSIYCDTINWILKYHSQGLIFHPETMLSYHCQNHGLKLIEKDFGEIVLRKLGKTMPDGSYASDFGRWA